MLVQGQVIMLINPKTLGKIAVIGGGVIGAAIAHRLAKHCHEIVLFDSGPAGGSGATARSGGIVRSYDPDPLLMQLSMLGAIDLHAWESRGFPGQSPLVETGALYLCRESDSNLARLEHACKTIKDAGLQSTLHDANSSKAAYAMFSPSRKLLALHEHTGGYGDPRLQTRNLIGGLIQEDGLVFENCPVRGMQYRNAQWHLNLSYGCYKADTVVCAAGAYSKILLNEIPVFTRSIPLTQFYCSNLDLSYPIIDEDGETYLRPIRKHHFYAGCRVVTDCSEPTQLGPYASSAAVDAKQRLHNLFGDQVDLNVVNGIQGFDAYTHDYRPVLDFIKDAPGLYICTGTSGRGYKFATVLAEMVSIDLLDRGQNMPQLANCLEQLRLSRFNSDDIQQRVEFGHPA